MPHFCAWSPVGQDIVNRAGRGRCGSQGATSDSRTLIVARLALGWESEFLGPKPGSGPKPWGTLVPPECLFWILLHWCHDEDAQIQKTEGLYRAEAAPFGVG